jgi:hypothetical protein
MSSLTFAGFRDELARRLRAMHVVLQAPDDDWPGVLFVEVGGRLQVGGLYEVADLQEEGKRQLAHELLPAKLHEFRATRAGWVMPALSGEDEYLLVLALAHRSEALLAPIERGAGRPLLGEWHGPSRPTGLFVEPLLEVLAELRPRPACPDCGVARGEPHDDGCDVEVCTVCNGQRMLCDCWGHEPYEARWQGRWPGADECRRRGWYASRVEGLGWVQCAADANGARPDLNRLAFFKQTGWDGLYAESD